MSGDPRLAKAGRAMRLAAAASVSLAVVLLVLKAIVWLRTNSVAMLGSLADSGLDLLASLAMLLAVRVATTPADADHRFGHGKAEALAALGQTLLIGGSAVLLAVQAVRRLIAPAPVAAPELGIGVSVLAMVATLALVAYQSHVVRHTGSLAIRTDRMHYVSDLALNGAVILALALEAWARLTGADAVAGLGIAAYLAWGAVQSARHATDMLMDREWPEPERAQVLALAQAVPGVRDVHDVRTRTSGLTRFVQLHIAVDGAISVRDGHAIGDAVQAAVTAAFPHTDVLVHVDPVELVRRRAAP
jgi:ferrous-iron efflux pump FieF